MGNNYLVRWLDGCFFFTLVAWIALALAGIRSQTCQSCPNIPRPAALELTTGLGPQLKVAFTAFLTRPGSPRLIDKPPASPSLCMHPTIQPHMSATNELRSQTPESDSRKELKMCSLISSSPLQSRNDEMQTPRWIPYPSRVAAPA